MAKHNKKRNVGLIHEQLVRYVASSLIAEDQKAAEVAIQVIAKHFKPGTELYKEFRLFNALVNVPVGCSKLAERVLQESKKAAANHDPQRLRKEKSLLIKDINTSLAGSSRFYDIKIENYRLFATVQTMLNEWRGAHRVDLTTRAKYEGNIAEHLSRGCDSAKESIEVDPLVQRIMYEKFENKYKGQLSNTQKTILESSVLGSDSEFCEIIQATKEQALVELSQFKKTCDNNILKEQLDAVRDSISSLPLEKTDDVIAKTLHLVHLIEEMTTDE